MRKTVLTSIAVVSLLFTAGPAQAFGLLTAVGSLDVRVVIHEGGAVEIVKTDKPANVRVEDMEPAAG